jgi:hypothetical protein
MQVIVQALQLPEASNKAFDLVSKPVGEGEPTTDFAALLNRATPGL